MPNISPCGFVRDLEKEPLTKPQGETLCIKTYFSDEKLNSIWILFNLRRHMTLFSVAQVTCDPPVNHTYWDFTVIDPMTLDFFNATQNHSTIINFSTIPVWLFKTPNRVSYPDDPSESLSLHHKIAFERFFCAFRLEPVVPSHLVGESQIHHWTILKNPLSLSSSFVLLFVSCSVLFKIT